ncbi:11835_t:CDS:2, partial [Gigaspora rosea]
HLKFLKIIVVQKNEIALFLEYLVSGYWSRSTMNSIAPNHRAII